MRPPTIELLEDRRLLSATGVTILTHGFQLDESFPDWVITMGQAILDRADGPRTDRVTGSIFRHHPASGQWQPADNGVWNNSNRRDDGIAAQVRIDNVILLSSPAIAGDFDYDGDLDGSDIDTLTAAIAAGNTNTVFDLTGDQQVNLSDLHAWLAIAGAANLPSGNAYLLGDANLDGVVDGSDFGTWNANKFTAVAAWTRGDFNADGVVDGSDFGLWNSNKFQSAVNVVIHVPAQHSLAMESPLHGNKSATRSFHSGTTSDKSSLSFTLNSRGFALDWYRLTL